MGLHTGTALGLKCLQHCAPHQGLVHQVSDVLPPPPLTVHRDGLEQNTDFVPLYFDQASVIHSTTSSFLRHHVVKQMLKSTHQFIILFMPLIYFSQQPWYAKIMLFLTREGGLCISHLALTFPAKRCRGKAPSPRKEKKNKEETLSLLSRVLIGSLIKPATICLLELHQCYIRNGIGTSLFAANRLPQQFK